MNITVIGCGRWGSFIAWYLDRTGHTVTLYGRKSSSHIQQFIATRSNGLLTLPESIQLTTDLDAVDKADVIVISIAAQSLDSLMTQLQTMKLQNKIFVLCMKGIEIGTGRRLSQIASAHLDVSNKVAVWIGPGHVQEFYNGIPNCMVIDSEDEQVKKQLLEAFSSDLIRFYYGQDMIGNEIGAAAKNVIGIAAGMLDGFGLTTLKGALMSLGNQERLPDLLQQWGAMNCPLMDCATWVTMKLRCFQSSVIIVSLASLLLRVKIMDSWQRDIIR